MAAPVVNRRERPKALDPAEVSEALLSLHNQIRKDENMPSLSISRSLTAAARHHARDMAQRRKMEHKGGDGSTPMTRAQLHGYRVRRVGENIAYGYGTPEAVMKIWMRSRTHRANILGSFSDIGTGYATAEDGTPYWCVNFGVPARRN
jgi:uncharacterized protein YkwD